MLCAFIYLVTIPLLASSGVRQVRLELSLKRYTDYDHDGCKRRNTTTTSDSHWSDSDWGCYPNFKLELFSPRVSRPVFFYCDAREPNHECDAHFGRQITSSLSNPFIFDMDPPNETNPMIEFEWAVYRDRISVQFFKSLDWPLWIAPDESRARINWLYARSSGMITEFEYRLYCTPGYFGHLCRSTALSTESSTTSLEKSTHATESPTTYLEESTLAAEFPTTKPEESQPATKFPATSPQESTPATTSPTIRPQALKSAPRIPRTEWWYAKLKDIGHLTVW
ncbi:unnamed protein product [Calicophoron daubneyi]|uniref:Uncharacterized protein n=1 Tax=Calicophoron daubneyi TaxID=300641 RepID=A0AAV2TT43_CALDB